MKTKGFNDVSRLRFIRFLVLIALVLFLYLIKDYIVPLILAIIFAGLMHPIYRWFVKKFNGRKTLSAILTVVLFVLVIVIPSIFLLSEIIKQAAQVSQSIFPLIEEELVNPSNNSELPDWMPFRDQLAPYTEQISEKLSGLVGKLSDLILSGLSKFTEGTFVFFIEAFVMIYAMYFFIMGGREMFRKVSNFFPFTDEEFELLTDQVTSISRATIKGAFLIGIIQGFLVGVGFAVTGLPGAVFWGAVAAIMSIIPSVGASIVYIPAGIYLIMSGDVTGGTGLLIWGFGVVGTIDNVLRPILVGQDTSMPDVLILVTTLGGITLCGISGIILGPLIAGIFFSLLNIYREFLVTHDVE